MKYTSEQRLSVPEAAQELRMGHMVILQNSPFETYDVLCQAAQHSNRAFVQIAIKSADAHLSVALAGERVETLRLSPPYIEHETSPTNSTLAITIKAHTRDNPSTSFSIDECVKTIHTLVDPRTQPEDIEQPGEIMIQQAHAGGTLKRMGYSEAAVDLMRIAGLEPGAMLCKVPQHKEADREQSKDHLNGEVQPGIISVEAIARYRREHRISFISQVQLPTHEALFQLHHYQEIDTGLPYLALVLGDLHSSPQPPLVRIHSACMTGDIFGSQRCDCQAQLHAAMHAIAEEGRGMLLYLPQEGRGIGLSAKLQAYVLQEQGYDTIEANERLGYAADARTFESAIEILQRMDIRNVRLMTNNPQKILALEEGGIVVERVALEMPATEDNAFYLQTKHERFGHLYGPHR
jgi:3,4-dihydroxy 2-butanone 4-phosphate synthase / GTP cyclohydrolase II